MKQIYFLFMVCIAKKVHSISQNKQKTPQVREGNYEH